MSHQAEPYPGFRKEARAADERARKMREAAAEALPGPLEAAFAGVALECGGLRVRPMVHYDFVILKRLDSPLLKHLAAAAKMAGRSKRKTPPTTWTDEQGYEMIYQFTRPVDESYAFFAKHGAAATARFREMALREIGLKLGPVEVAVLVQEVVRVFVEAFSTRLKFEPKDPGDGGFQSPPPAGTGSDGGSTISAGSPVSTP